MKKNNKTNNVKRFFKTMTHNNIGTSKKNEKQQ